MHVYICSVISLCELPSYIQVGDPVCTIFQLHRKLVYKMNLIIVNSYYKMDMDIYMMYLVVKSVLLYFTDYSFNNFLAFKPEIKLKCFQQSIFITTTSTKCASILIIYVFIIHSISI